MKLVVKVLLWSLVTLSGTRISLGAPELPSYIGHVNDFANVLDAATKTQLETILTNFEVRTGAQIAVVTVTTLGDQPIEDYALALYRAWGVGSKSGPNKNKGALLLVAVGDRKSRLEVGYGLEGDIPDGLAGEMLRRMRPFFREQRWAEGLTLGVRTLVDTLAQKWNISIEGIDQQYAYSGAPVEEDAGSPLGLLVGLVVLVIVLMIIARISRRGGGSGGGPGAAAWLGPLIFNRGGGGFGGGSWGSSGGGGGGGGGWGGFGGGSSGGGGASDSW